MKTKILVTGAGGFIGGHLVPELQKRKYDVVEFHKSDGNIAQSGIKDIRHIFHLAAETFVPESWKRPYDFYQVNVMGTVAVLEFCRLQNCSMTFLSSYVYGNPLTSPINETHPVNPNSPYNQSKLLAEDVCRFYAGKFNVITTVLRPFNIYGPRQKDVYLVPHIIRQALDSRCESIKVMDLAPRRDYVFIDDLVDAMARTIGRTAFSIYNVGSGVSYSVEDIIKTVLRLLHSEKEYVSEAVRRKDEVMDTVADINKIRSELSWEPKHSIEEGLMKTIDAIRNGTSPFPQASPSVS